MFVPVSPSGTGNTFQDDYYDAIAKCHVEGESTVFIEFMLAQIDNILDELLNQMTNSATDDAILDANGANHDVSFELQLKFH